MKAKVFSLIFALFIGVMAFAADTISIDCTDITREICDVSVNSRDQKVNKYYFIYKGELISTSKTVVEKYRLCKKYNAKIALVIIKKGNDKRIVLN